MSKAERYIELVSDENGHLCDQHALKAVEIARAEIYEWLNSHNDYIAVNGSITRFDMEKCITDLKQAMKDE